MNFENPFLQKTSIDYRFIRAVQELLYSHIAHTQGEIAQELGVKNAKFSEIMNGRMHVGVDMLAILSESYLVNPDWLLTGRGERMFRKTSILPTRLEDGEENQEHPYTFEDEDEVIEQRIREVEEEKRQQQSKSATPILMDLIADKDKQLLRQAEEIGQLRERIAQMQQRFEKSAASATTDTIANVG